MTSEIHAVDGVLVPRSDAAYLVSIIDFLVLNGRNGGAAPSAKLMEIRRALADSARVNASDDQGDVPLVVALNANSIVSVSEVALVLGIKPDSVRWHWRRGNLEGRKVGRQLMIDVASLEAFALLRSA